MGDVQVTGGPGTIVADRHEIAHLTRTYYAESDDVLMSVLILRDGIAGAADGDLATALAHLDTAAHHCQRLSRQLFLAGVGYPWGTEVITLLASGDVIEHLLSDAWTFVDDLFTRGPGYAGQHLLTHDPALVDILVNEGHLAGAGAAAAGLLDDGHGVAVDTGLDVDGPSAVIPRRLTDLLTDLSERNDDGRHDGAVDVRVVTGPHGERHVIVDITGLKAFDVTPGGDVADLTSCGLAVGGARSAYEEGVLAAMRAAGVRRTDPVMIVGHSLGGMVAITTARDAVRTGEFRVTHVVTAGSPIGRTAAQVPAGVRVLALENSTDVVPHLDGRTNPALRNVTTVSGAYGDGTIGDDHSLPDGYLPLARDAEGSANGSITDFLDTADPWFRGTSVATHTYQIRRRN